MGGHCFGRSCAGAIVFDPSKGVVWTAVVYLARFAACKQGTMGWFFAPGVAVSLLNVVGQSLREANSLAPYCFGAFDAAVFLLCVVGLFAESMVASRCHAESKRFLGFLLTLVTKGLGYYWLQES